MRGKRFTEEQIVSILKESSAGMKTDDLCRRHGICQNTYYRWKAKYADMEVSDVRRLKDLETENGKLKRIVAEQMLDIQALKVALGKNTDAFAAERSGGGDEVGDEDQRTPGVHPGRYESPDVPLPASGPR